jgi:DNA-directed RNA polymerase subunit RPC12/RpoP/MFS family permease
MLKRLLRHIIPSPAALTFVWIGLGAFFIFSALAVLLSVAGSDIYSFFAVFTAISFPGLALMLAIAALREKRAAPRSILWAGVTLSMGFSIGSFIIGSFIHDNSGAEIIPMFCCFCSPLYMIPGSLTLIFAIKSWSQLRQALNADRSQRAMELLSARGEASFTEIGRELDLPEQQVEPLIREWYEAADMIVTIDPVHRRVYTPLALIEKYRQLEAIVQARGQIYLTDLEDELQVPREILHRWVRKLVRKNILSGYLDWEEGLLSSLEANQLEDLEHCPHCGGETNLAGKGIIRCTYCGVEIFLPSDTLPAPKEQAQRTDYDRHEAPGLLYGEPHLAKAAARRTPFQRLRQLFWPNKRALTMMTLALLVFVLGSTCSLSFFFVDVSAEVLSVVLTALSIFVIPIVAVMLAIAAFLDQRNPPRTIISALATLVISLAGLLLIILMSLDPTGGFEIGAFSGIMFVAPIVMIFSLPVIYFGLKTWPEVQAVLRLKTEQRVLQLVREQGAVSFGEISQKLVIPYDEVDNLVDDLLRSGQLYGTMDAERGWVYTAQSLEEKRSRLLDDLHTQGQIRLDKMAHQLEIPLKLLRELIYQSVQADQFSGYINWEEGMLYSVAAEQLGAESLCPNCGGKLGLEGEVIECQHCGSEILRG